MQTADSRQQTADESLFDFAFQGDETREVIKTLTKEPLRGGYTRLSLNEFNVFNKSGYSTENCFVWFPTRYSRHLYKRIEFYVRANVKNCIFYFFKIPNINSKIKLVLKGEGHSGVFLSENQMTFTATMVGKMALLAIGENTYVAGARIILNNSIVSIGADGLLSDEILLQSTDSHGVVDLDTMEVVNNDRGHINLERRVWLGRRSTIKKGVVIGEGSIVATGAVVTKNVSPACLVAGVPAQVKKHRVSWSRRLHGITSEEQKDLVALRKKLDGGGEVI